MKTKNGGLKKKILEADKDSVKVVFKLRPLKGAEQENQMDADLLRQGLACTYNTCFYCDYALKKGRIRNTVKILQVY